MVPPLNSILSIEGRGFYSPIVSSTLRIESQFSPALQNSAVNAARSLKREKNFCAEDHKSCCCWWWWSLLRPGSVAMLLSMAQRLLIWVFLISCTTVLVSGQDGPLNFTHDRNDGRMVWIQNRTSETIQKIEYRRVFRDSDGQVQQSNTSWQQIPYDPQIPIWRKPDGVCGEYEISATTSDGKSYSQTLETPAPTLKTTSKLQPTRIFFDPIRNRVMAEIIWGNDFDYWTAAGAVLIQTSPWTRMITCQSVFKTVVPPPSLENRGTLWSFDPEYARNNCTFIFGLNGTLQIMQTPPTWNRGSQLVVQPQGVNGQLIQTPFGGGPVIQPSQAVIIQQPNGQIVQQPIHASANPNPGMPKQQAPPTVNADQQQQNCDKINFSTSVSNDSLLLNLSCETVSGSTAFCVPPQRQCRLDCSPTEIRAYSMQDSSDYLKLEWQFPDMVQREAKQYHLRYAEANVTPWNTVYLEKEASETTMGANQTYVEVRKFSTGAASSTNFTLQICASLGECNSPIQWELERKYAIGYTPRPAASQNLMYSANRRRGKSAAKSNKRMDNRVLAIMTGMLFAVFYL